MSNNIVHAVRILEEGGVIIYPTDTIWGIGCDATDPIAVMSVANLKQNRADKGFIVLMDSIKMVKNYFTFPLDNIKHLLLDENPTTVILPDPTGLPKSVLAPDGSLAVRIPKDPICLDLIRGLHRPVLSTSANFSGYPVPSQFSEISTELLKGVDYIINLRQDDRLGTSSSRLIRVSEKGKMKILRN